MAQIFRAAFVTHPLKICCVGARFLSSKTFLIIEKYLESQAWWFMLISLAWEVEARGSVQGQPWLPCEFEGQPGYSQSPPPQYIIKPSVVSRAFDTSTQDAKAKCQVRFSLTWTTQETLSQKSMKIKGEVF